MLTRMRQIALHPGLVPANYLEQLRSNDANIDSASQAVVLTPEEKLKLQGCLAQAIEDCEECPICFQVLSNESRITSCAHPFCFAWYRVSYVHFWNNPNIFLLSITEILSRDPKCPLVWRPCFVHHTHLHSMLQDRRILAMADLIEPLPPTDLTQRPYKTEESENLGGGSSAKIEQLIHLLKLTPTTEKSLVFSQFTSFIDKVCMPLFKVDPF